ncbi:hypothetical protein CK203_059729 [Vitis vinifera]|uniref:RNase H type-1 domain-containing protein n=1 Tax=Vitis vinifera TaxID=29760 RepID=A0A438G7Q6_VITVI|nr:hypothetical protein CK203_059729 [Vitis vinifera]
MDERMARYLAMVEDHLKNLDEWIVRLVPRKENMKADALAGIVATLLIKEAMMLSIYLQATPELVCSTNEANLGWMHDIVKYL